MLAAVLAALAVAPSAPVVPQRLLRISIRFAQPVGPAAAPAFGLRASGGEIAHPFADPPLWSADLRTVTLLLDPARQKIGLRDHDTAGFVLPSGGEVALTAGGHTIKRWRVTPGGCAPLDPARWRIGAVRSGTREPLIVRFAGPVDALSGPYLAIARGDAPLEGTGALVDAERAWRFVPATAWRTGDRLAIHPRFEDPCGDEVGDPFERTDGGGLGPARPTQFKALRVLPTGAA